MYEAMFQLNSSAAAQYHIHHSERVRLRRVVSSRTMETISRKVYVRDIRTENTGHQTRCIGCAELCAWA